MLVSLFFPIYCLPGTLILGLSLTQIDLSVPCSESASPVVDQHCFEIQNRSSNFLGKIDSAEKGP